MIVCCIPFEMLFTFHPRGLIHYVLLSLQVLFQEMNKMAYQGVHSMRDVKLWAAFQGM